MAMMIKRHCGRLWAAFEYKARSIMDHNGAKGGLCSPDGALFFERVHHG